jgi:hypothetical protein
MELPQAHGRERTPIPKPLVTIALDDRKTLVDSIIQVSPALALPHPHDSSPAVGTFGNLLGGSIVSPMPLVVVDNLPPKIRDDIIRFLHGTTGAPAPPSSAPHGAPLGLGRDSTFKDILDRIGEASVQDLAELQHVLPAGKRPLTRMIRNALSADEESDPPSSRGSAAESPGVPNSRNADGRFAGAPKHVPSADAAPLSLDRLTDLLERARTDRALLEDQDGESANDLSVKIDFYNAEITSRNDTSRRRHESMEDTQEVTALTFSFLRSVLHSEQPVAALVAATEAMSMKQGLDMARQLAQSAETLAATRAWRAQYPLISLELFGRQGGAPSDITDLGPLLLPLVGAALEDAAHFIATASAAARLKGGTFGRIADDMDGELAMRLRLNHSNMFTVDLDPVENLLLIAPVAQILARVLTGLVVAKVSPAVLDLYDFFRKVTFVTPDGETVLVQTWEEYRAIMRKVELIGAPFTAYRVFGGFVKALGGFTSSGAGTGDIPATEHPRSDMELLFPVPLVREMTFERFAQACVTADSCRDPEGHVSPEKLQAMTDCLYRYQEAAATLAAARDRYSDDGALHSMRAAGGGSSGGNASFGKLPCPYCSGPIPAVSGFCVPCARALPGAWVCSGGGGMGCGRIISGTRGRCVCQSPKTGITPTAAIIATNVQRVLHAPSRA